MKPKKYFSFLSCMHSQHKEKKLSSTVRCSLFSCFVFGFCHNPFFQNIVFSDLANLCVSIHNTFFLSKCLILLQQI